MGGIGLIVNPIAGLGGRVGLKGSDGRETLEQALALGAIPRAGELAGRALRRFASRSSSAAVLTCLGAMGGEAAQAVGLRAIELGIGRPPTSAGDTRAAAAAMRDAGVELVLFAGGDGTARDVRSAVGVGVPILGIPCGVKMQSGVFATSPEAAGELAALFLDIRTGIGTAEAEVVDLDEEALRRGRMEPRLFGLARTPFERRLVQSPKARGLAGDGAVEGACAEVAAEVQDRAGTLHLIGPGATMQRVLRHLGLLGSLLGIDAVIDGTLAGRDLGERQIEALAEGRPMRIVLGVVGGQGFLLGRGNQPLTPNLIRRAGRDGLIVVASQEKLSALADGTLLVDTGDVETDRMLTGYLRVRTGPGVTALLRVSTTSIRD